MKRAGPGRPKLRPRAVVGDRGYSGRPVRDGLRRLGVSPVIPQLKTEKTPRLMDWDLYRERNVVERLVGRLKEYRQIATRYDKLAASYLAFVCRSRCQVGRRGRRGRANPCPAKDMVVVNRSRSIAF